MPSTACCNASKNAKATGATFSRTNGRSAKKSSSSCKIIAERGSVRFAELFESAASRSEVVCTFLALLELIRLKQLVCAQPEPFAEIEIRRALDATDRLVATGNRHVETLAALKRRCTKCRTGFQLLN